MSRDDDARIEAGLTGHQLRGSLHVGELCFDSTKECGCCDPPGPYYFTDPSAALEAALKVARDRGLKLRIDVLPSTTGDVLCFAMLRPKDQIGTGPNDFGGSACVAPSDVAKGVATATCTAILNALDAGKEKL